MKFTDAAVYQDIWFKPSSTAAAIYTRSQGQAVMPKGELAPHWVPGLTEHCRLVSTCCMMIAHWVTFWEFSF